VDLGNEAPGRLGELTGSLLGRCTFPPAGQEVVAAVSGGADSLALLVLALAAGCVVTAVHADAAARFGADFRALRVEVGLGPDLEARARLARYTALPSGVLTGHTADDQAETVVLNLIRGAGLSGLAGMTADAHTGPADLLRRSSGPGEPGAHSVRRPLIGLRRSDTEAVCRAAGLAPVDDPSNTDPRFMRNRVRLDVLPLLAEVGRRDLVPILCRQAAVLADDAALLDELARGLDPTDARALTSAPLPLARRAVRAWLRAGADAERHPPSSAEVARVLGVARGDVVACEVSGGRRVARRAWRLHLSDPLP
jgi:tRNA(Ile)-lysidine synthase